MNTRSNLFFRWPTAASQESKNALAVPHTDFIMKEKRTASVDACVLAGGSKRKKVQDKSYIKIGDAYEIISQALNPKP